MQLSAFTFASMPELSAPFEVVVRGKRIAARPVPWKVEALIEEALPEPAVPKIKDPGKGSLAPEIEDPEPEKNAGWVAARAMVRRKQRACEVAWAMHATTKNGLKAPLIGDAREDWAVWCMFMGDEFMEKMPFTEVAGLMAQIAAHGAMHQVAGQVPNLSAPPAGA